MYVKTIAVRNRNPILTSCTLSADTSTACAVSNLSMLSPLAVALLRSMYSYRRSFDAASEAMKEKRGFCFHLLKVQIELACFGCRTFGLRQEFTKGRIHSYG